MKEAILLIAILIIFAVGYRAMGKIGSFIAKNQRISTTGLSPAGCNIIIATQDKNIISDIKPVLNNFTATRPEYSFTLRPMSKGQMADKLRMDKVDIALITSATLAQGNTALASRRTTLAGQEIYIVWNPKIKSSQRNRVIAMLENQPHYRTTGYVDYI